MRILADENISKEVTNQLRQAGYDVKEVVRGKGLSDFDVGRIANEEGRLVITNDAKTFVRENLSQGQVLKEGVLVNQLGNVSDERKAAHIKEFLIHHEKDLHGKVTTLEWNTHRQVSIESLAEKMQKNLSPSEKSQSLETLEKSTFDKAKEMFRAEGKKLVRESEEVAKTLAKDADKLAKTLEKSPNSKAKILGYALDYGLDVVDFAVDVMQKKESMAEKSEKPTMSKEVSRGADNISKEVQDKGKDYEQ